MNAEDIEGSAPEFFVGGGSFAVVEGAGPEDDADAQAGDEDEPPGGEAGVFSEQFSKKIAELDVLVIEMHQHHVDEAQAAPEIQTLLPGAVIAGRRLDSRVHEWNNRPVADGPFS